MKFTDFRYIYHSCHLIGQGNEVSNCKDNGVSFFFMQFANNKLNLHLVKAFLPLHLKMQIKIGVLYIQIL